MYKYYNANPYGNRIEDCVIRCLSVLTNKSWEDVYNELTDLSGDVGLLFNNVEFVEDYLDERYPRECHYSKTLEEFARENPYGKYAVSMNGHITTVVNGDIIDVFDPSKRVIRCAWKVE